MQSDLSIRSVVPIALWCFLLASPAIAQQAPGDREGTRVSPVRRIEGRHTGSRDRATSPARFPSLDGSGHNLADPEVGAADTQLIRLIPSDYADGLSALAGPDRPDPRTISNIVISQPGDKPNPRGASDFLWQWGQFVDHDIDLTDGVDPPEPANIPIPAGDPWFDPDGSGTVELSFNRSIYDESTGIDAPRQQLNEVTAWIDGSNVYGADVERGAALRTLDGTGQLRTSEGDLLPYNTEGLANAGGSGPELFLAGDVRANEQVGLTAMHTLFVREHNRLAERIAAAEPGLSGEEIYQRARLLVIGEMQVITYREFLPMLLGPEALPPYRYYDPEIEAGISNLFSSASYRFGHSALSPTLLRLDANGDEIAAGHLSLRDAFFAPSRIVDEGGIEPLLRGMANQACQSVDAYVIDDLRNFLFGPPGAGGFDLTSLNIQRGREHGLPSYADARAAMGLARPANFADISSDPEVQARLEEAYGDVEAVDVWLGGLAEDPLPGAMVGELIAAVLRDQFIALRDGDGFWYENVLGRRERAEVEATRLSDVIRRNTEIGRELPDDVFRARSIVESPPAPGRPRRGR
jgi:peroxidase